MLAHMSWQCSIYLHRSAACQYLVALLLGLANGRYKGVRIHHISEVVEALEVRTLGAKV